MCVFYFYYAPLWTRMRKIIDHHIEGGTRKSHQSVQDLQFIRPAKSWILKILDTPMGFSCLSLNLNVVLGYNILQFCFLEILLHLSEVFY